MSDVIRKFARALGAAEPPKPVAGYLPAPKQARFVSRAEEAAQRLPANIKAQSVPNQLHKFGAKPVELEYAGLGDFLKGKDKVSSQDVLAHLQQQGPLGQLKRVDQGDAPGTPEAWQDHTDQENPFGDVLGQDDFDFVDNENFMLPGQASAPQPPRNFYQSDARAPFGSDPKGSFPKTVYKRYTVPGTRGDFTGYREVLLEDPKARVPPQDPEEGSYHYYSMVEDGDRGSIDAKHSDYWLRYNNLPDSIAIQNVQSDIGQKLSGNPAALKDLNEQLATYNARRRELAEGLNDETRLHFDNENEEIREIDEYISNMLSANEDRFEIAYHPDGSEYLKTWPGRESPIARDNNWKNLMLRHALLESVNQGGKPITLPTGQQMVDVEYFGQGGKGSTADPAEKATRFNEDLANRLLKAFKEIHPEGATVEKPRNQDSGPYWHDHETEQPMTFEYAQEQDEEFRRSLLEGLGDIRNVGLEAEQYIRYPSVTEGHNYTLSGREYLQKRWGNMTQPERDAVMKSVQYDNLMREMGMGTGDLPRSSEIPPHRIAPGNDPGNDPNAPGWTIKPHPETVRAALENGVPIMSIAPFLLQQSLMSQQEENR